MSSEVGSDGVGEVRRDAESGAEGVGVDRGAGAGVVVVGDFAGVVDERGRDRHGRGQGGSFLDLRDDGGSGAGRGSAAAVSGAGS